jgi:hypothetical protein
VRCDTEVFFSTTMNPSGSRSWAVSRPSCSGRWPHGIYEERFDQYELRMGSRQLRVTHNVADWRGSPLQVTFLTKNLRGGLELGPTGRVAKIMWGSWLLETRCTGSYPAHDERSLFECSCGKDITTASRLGDTHVISS